MLGQVQKFTACIQPSEEHAKGELEPPGLEQFISYSANVCFTLGKPHVLFKELSGDLPQRGTHARLDPKACWSLSSANLPGVGWPFSVLMLCDISII